MTVSAPPTPEGSGPGSPDAEGAGSEAPGARGAGPESATSPGGPNPLAPSPVQSSDLTAPLVTVFKLGGKARLSTLIRRGIAPQFRCDEACSITVRAYVKKRGAKSRTTVLHTGATPRSTAPRMIRLKLDRHRLNNLAQRELTLEIFATDASGNRNAITRILTLR